MLKFCGHPFVDVGIATITAFCGKSSPEELETSDLQAVADYLAEIYVDPCMTGYLSIAFTMNAGYTQPGYSKTPHKKAAYAQKVLRAFSPEVPKRVEVDVFLGLPIADQSFGVEETEKRSKGRAYRQHIPLLTGEDVINFFPYGDAGLPVSGEALLAIQALPLGCVKIAGKLLAVHSDNPEIMIYFARKFLEQNRLEIQLARQNREKFSPDVHRLERTLLVELLLEATEFQKEAQSQDQPFSITAYHFSNSGQGPSLDIYHLPMQTIAFLRIVQSAGYRNEWSKIVTRAWQKPPIKKGASDETFVPPKNYLFEDLFSLPENASRFLRTYFLRIPVRSKDAQDPRSEYSFLSEADIVNWKIPSEFLRRILNMEKERIEKIRNLGDVLAEYVNAENDTRFFRDFFTQNRYDYFRNTLLKANLAAVSRRKPPILSFDSYIQIFEEGLEIPAGDWRLARDLVLIRMIERLYQLGWFGTHEEVLTELPVEDQENVI
ncbi:MAG: type I-B CRISPR-associated protein Cas8b1/Cst1 [Anaerolineales bacterium]|nr:type I-B CRISPR-associated protein Cas8b1/Cst1 [Anaerolineales bacterium]MCS7249056.1 type I-B CRISPR-associated protein Cas8b1/Cst1 [Anaerolineales bacterium]MDW8162869.1 type I-B CRISPR-associated protein Cas8b1/Cst1 [Anaerolineales bacterium]MDW8446844.1 type I-B CRISPR-associated protein Cas8b1/Cst1 [Anaerolineales bacterium]